MLEFILANIAMISAGVVLYIVARSLPRIGREEKAVPQGVIDRWMTAGIPEKLDGIFNSFAGKFLRKCKVGLLKLDNIVSSALKSFKQKNGNGKTLDFKEMMGDKEESDKGQGTMDK